MRIIAMIAATALLLVPSVGVAQDGYRYELNGRVFMTNPNTMSGPGGCRSTLLNIETGQLVCPGDAVASPESVWRLQIARHCGLDRDVYGGRGTERSRCIGAFVAVGDNCPQRPRTCRYFRITDDWSDNDSWTVRVSRVHQLGNELWIAAPHESLWSLFSRCHSDQYTAYDNRYRC